MGLQQNGLWLELRYKYIYFYSYIIKFLYFLFSYNWYCITYLLIFTIIIFILLKKGRITKCNDIFFAKCLNSSIITILSLLFN